MKRVLIVDTISALFVLLFTYASLSKLLDFGEFRVQLGQSPLLTRFVGWIVWVVPALEIAIVTMLIIRRYRTAGLYASFALMVLFTAYIIAITRFSEFIPCSCGGILKNMNWSQHLYFNIVFILLGTIAILINEESSKSQIN